MTGSFVCEPPCSVCGVRAARLEMVAPGDRPARWEQWSPAQQRSFTEYRPVTSWWVLFEGIVAGNGIGSEPSPAEGERLARIFSEPLTWESVHSAGFYDDLGFCRECGVAYCANHWSVSAGGYGRCPRGHGKSLDPHWSPADYD